MLIQYNSEKFIIPLNIDLFLYDYTQSRFLECGRIFSHPNKKTNEEKKIKRKLELSLIKKIFLSDKINYWLEAKSYLKWLENCDFPDKSDIFISFDQLSNYKFNSLVNDFKLNHNYLQLNFTKSIDYKNYKMKFGTDKTVYVFSSNEKRKAKFNFKKESNIENDLIRKSKICSADILEIKFSVLCRRDNIL